MCVHLCVCVFLDVSVVVSMGTDAASAYCCRTLSVTTLCSVLDDFRKK